MPAIEQLLHEGDLLRDVFCCAGHLVGGGHAQGGHVGAEDRLPAIGKCANLDALCRCGANDLVVNVGQVHHPTHRATARAEPAHQRVGEEEATEVPDMRWAVNGGPARVDPNLRWV